MRDDAVRVVVLHPDEALLDSLQCALEEAGIANRALVPAPGDGLAALAPYLPARPAVAVVGLRPPYRDSWALLVALQQAYPACALVLLAADPQAALAGWQGLVYPLVIEDDAAEEGVVQAVRAPLWAPRPVAGA